MMAVNIFLLLGAYYLLKPVREALILSESGAEVKSYSAAAQALLLLAVVPFYGWFATKGNRSRLLASLICFFSANLVLFWFVGSRGAHQGVVFYIWVGIFSVFVVSQFWAYANDLHRGSRQAPVPIHRRRDECRCPGGLPDGCPVGQESGLDALLADVDCGRCPFGMHGNHAGRERTRSPNGGPGNGSPRGGARRHPRGVYARLPGPLSLLDRRSDCLAQYC